MKTNIKIKSASKQTFGDVVAGEVFLYVQTTENHVGETTFYYNYQSFCCIKTFSFNFPPVAVDLKSGRIFELDNDTEVQIVKKCDITVEK